MGTAIGFIGLSDLSPTEAGRKQSMESLQYKAITALWPSVRPCEPYAFYPVFDR